MKAFFSAGSLAVAAGLLACSSQKPVSAPAQAAPASPSLETVVTERVAPLVRDHWASAVSIALVDEKGTRFVSLGEARPGVPTTPDTRFEVGSVSKTFTSLALATMVEDHTVTLDTEVRALLPADVTVPSKGRAITLLDLATHTSGLPTLPTNLPITSMVDPYAGYDAAKLYAFLGSYTLTRAPGDKFEYSNLGAGLLGHALARKNGTTYEAMLRTRVLAPLGMTATSVDDDAGLAEGHDADGEKIGPWHLNVLAGAGQVRSSARDMAKYVRAQLGLDATPLASAMALTHVSRHDSGAGNGHIGLAWQLSSKGWVWHNGETGGAHTFVGFDPKKRVGVVLLASGATHVVDLVGADLMKLVSGEEPGPSPIPETKQLEPAALEGYVGTYRISPEFALVISRQGGQLIVQATGQPRHPLFAHAADEFYLRIVDAKVRFVREKGAITGLVLSQGGHEMPAKRI